MIVATQMLKFVTKSTPTDAKEAKAEFSRLFPNQVSCSRTLRLSVSVDDYIVAIHPVAHAVDVGPTETELEPDPARLGRF